MWVPNFRLREQKESAVYYVIRTSEDGDVSLDAMTKETLLQRLNTRYWGDQIIRKIQPGERVNLQDQSGVYIIEGEVVVPYPKEVVKEWVV